MPITHGQEQKRPLVLHDFTLSTSLNQIGPIHTPKGRWVPLVFRQGVLSEIDLSPHPNYQPESGEQENLADINITQTGGNGRIHCKAELVYKNDTRDEMELDIEGYCNDGLVYLKAKEVTRSYSTRDNTERLVYAQTYRYHWKGRIMTWYTYEGPVETPTDFARNAMVHYGVNGEYTCRRFCREMTVSTPGHEKWRVREMNPWGGNWSPGIKPHGYRGDTRPTWFRGDYIVAYGEADKDLLPDLERLERFLASTTATVNAGKLDLAAKQTEQLAAMLDAMRKQLAAEGNRSSVRVVALPTSPALDKLRSMQTLMARLKSLRLQAVEHVDQLQKDIQSLKLNFMDNVMKGMFKSYLSWSGALPSDPVDGFAGYSLNTSLFNLPRNLAGMLESAEKDSSILKNQVQAIRTMEKLQRFWEDVRDNATSECRRLVKHIEDSDADRLVSLHKQTAATLNQQAQGQ